MKKIRITLTLYNNYGQTDYPVFVNEEQIRLLDWLSQINDDITYEKIEDCNITDLTN